MGKTILSQSFGTVIFWVKRNFGTAVKSLIFFFSFFKQGILFSLLHTEHIHSDTTEASV